MSFSLIKIISSAIFIAEKNNNKILTMLLIDYAKTRLSKSQYIYILMLSMCLHEKNIFENEIFYKLLTIYIELHSTKLCRSLILS